ncbi:AraC family transcriptional regulator [Gilvibacter sediminis]|uniref:AraC family transcriptional regulator n=1 Tax=Gilvibacter sediminis TaxID=379071 RepID=UPI00235057CF|nr:AraC family transcriptional regulator [Gilvibacter sediminis]MDC7998384.1 AraC family transcriptional regulator [Gilvibacter sediminis]
MDKLSFKNQKDAFPLHYHSEFCISLIKKGVELINIKEKQFVGQANDITITHPYELHANPMYSETNLLSFDTLYVSDALIREILPLGKTFHFDNRVIRDLKLNELFEKIMITSTEVEKPLLEEFVVKLSSYSELTQEPKISKPLDNWEDIETYIEQHIKENISLDQLASIANLNKYSFSRKFKDTTGITPVHYTLMKKVFHCKETITKQCTLTEKAYEYNFTDISHFSKAFKKFVGVRPTTYQQKFLP